MKPTLKKKSDLAMRHNRLRARILTLLHCRTTMILVSLFVVLECICVMAELMVDLQALRLRFDNEENEIEKFVQYMKSTNTDIFEKYEGRSLEDLLNVLKTTSTLWRDSSDSSYEQALCNCSCSDSMNESSHFANRQKRSKPTLPVHLSYIDVSRTNLLKPQIATGSKPVLRDKMTRSITNPAFPTYHSNIKSDAKNKLRHILRISDHPIIRKNITASDMMFSQLILPKQDNTKSSNNIKVHETIDRKIKLNQVHTSSVEVERSTDSLQYRVPRLKRDAVDSSTSAQNLTNVFVFSLFAENKQFHIVAEVVNVEGDTDAEAMLKEKGTAQSQYEVLHDVSHSIKFIGFAILSLMLVETLVKVACLGLHFFKRKIEVFDACIVLISFVLDVVFLDSKWYETGKDATTILVLLLPWRVVRIVNSFIISINHKHHIEIMTVRRAKKKCDMKMKKLQQLMHEMRRDVDLLIRLCKNRGATEAEITTCIYGKGRGTTTVAAMTSFASLMFISTLGKDPSIAEVEDDVYGEFIRVILEEEEEQDESDKVVSDPSKDEDPEDTFILEHDQVYSVSKTFGKRSGSGKTPKTHDKWTERRRATLPRRHQSCNDDESNGYYINDGYVTNDEKTRDGSVTSSSLPIIHKDATTKNFVTFEVTSQMVTQSYNTYL